MFILNHIFLQRGQRILFEDASLNIFAKQKLGIIGANGSGKSTLFAMLLGQLQPDKGEAIVPSALRIAHLSQETPALEIAALEYVKQGDQDLYHVITQLQQAEAKQDYAKVGALHLRYDEVGGYTATARAARLLHGLGFTAEEYQQPVKSFSGGWRMRLNLAQTLMCPADVLLLDEPTNHLDLDAIVWLENYLKNYAGTLLLISHDREFLDGIIDHVVHLDHRQFKIYSGNYSTFEKTRAEQLALQQAHHEKQQKQIAHMMEFVNRFRYKASKAKQAQSRLKAIERLDIVSAVQSDSPFYFEFKKAERCSNPLLRLEKIAVGYQDKIILQNVNLSILAGSRIGLLGPNGAGKSTLIKLLAGMLTPKQGIYEMERGLKIGYYAQHQLELLEPQQSPIQHLKQLDPRASEPQLRSFLGGFNFRDAMALSPIHNFSGGEKARLVLALLIWQAPNLLLLDEPTNHLDLEMRNALTLALQSYEGAMIIISHDRHLLRTSVDEFILIAQQQVRPFAGSLEDYQDELERLYATEKADFSEKSIVAQPASQTQQKSKNRAEKKIKQLEAELNQLQIELTKIEETLAAPDIYQPDNKALLAEKITQQKLLKEKIMKVEEHWLQLL